MINGKMAIIRHRKIYFSNSLWFRNSTQRNRVNFLIKRLRFWDFWSKKSTRNTLKHAGETYRMGSISWAPTKIKRLSSLETRQIRWFSRLKTWSWWCWNRRMFWRHFFHRSRRFCWKCHLFYSLINRRKVEGRGFWIGWFLGWKGSQRCLGSILPTWTSTANPPSSNNSSTHSSSSSNTLLKSNPLTKWFI